MAVPPGLAVIPEWMYYSGLVSYFLSIALIGLLFFLSIKTPVMTWLKAIIKRSPLFFIAGRDNIGGFFASNRRASNWAEIKKLGLFFISEGSFIFDRKSKLPVYLAHQEFGATINLDWAEILEKLKEKFEIKDGKDYKRVIEDKNNKDVVLELSNGKTFKISDLQQYFPVNIRPDFIKSVAENEKRRATLKAENMKIISVIGFAVLLVCIGGYILIGKINEGKAVCNCNCAEKPPSEPGLEKADEKPSFDELTEPESPGVPGGKIT